MSSTENMSQDDFVQFFTEGGQYLAEENYQEAIGCFQHLVDNCPEDLKQNLPAVHNNLAVCYERKDGEVGDVKYNSDAYNYYSSASLLGHPRAGDVVWRCAFNAGHHKEGAVHLKIQAEFDEKEALEAIMQLSTIEDYDHLFTTDELVHFANKLVNVGYSREQVDQQIAGFKMKQMLKDDPEGMKTMLEEALKDLKG
jgi:tetratricopeptide (TPR) repeat protein